jgi:hypothetical protein
MCFTQSRLGFLDLCSQGSKTTYRRRALVVGALAEAIAVHAAIISVTRRRDPSASPRESYGMR